MKPFSHPTIHRGVPEGTFTHPEANFHVPDVFPHRELKVTHKARSTTHVLLKAYRNTYIEAANSHIDMQQSCQVALVPFASLSAISGTFNSLSKVLFTFPSWYLFAIGLEAIFSFR
jgi:hypothetical protein